MTKKSWSIFTIVRSKKQVEKLTEMMNKNKKLCLMYHDNKGFITTLLEDDNDNDNDMSTKRP